MRLRPTKNVQRSADKTPKTIAWEVLGSSLEHPLENSHPAHLSHIQACPMVQGDYLSHLSHLGLHTQILRSSKYKFWSGQGSRLEKRKTEKARTNTSTTTRRGKTGQNQQEAKVCPRTRRQRKEAWDSTSRQRWFCIQTLHQAPRSQSGEISQDN